MFSAISKVADYLLGYPADPEGQEGGRTARNPPLETLPPAAGADASLMVEDKREFYGRVTSIHEGYGLIDNETYFSNSVVDGNSKPQVGNTLHVTAVRKHKMGGWKATCVTPVSKAELLRMQRETEQWGDEVGDTLAGSTCSTQGILDDSSDARSLLHPRNRTGSESTDSQEDSLVAVVKSVNSDGGYLNDNLWFSVEATKEDYLPCRGDWVTARMVTDPQTGTHTAMDVKPLRRRDFEGKVVSVHQGFGFVDDEIYFSFDVCEEDYVPQRYDRVCGCAVETSQGKNMWRAIRVEPMEDVQDIVQSSLAALGPTQKQWSQELFSNKGGITISGDSELGHLKLGQVVSKRFCIRNTSSETVSFKSYKLHNSMQSQFEVGGVKLSASDDSTTGDLPVPIEAGRSIEICVICNSRNPGLESQLLLFEFNDFKIARKLSVNVVDPIQGDLGPRAPYARRSGGARSKVAGGLGWLVPGERPQIGRVMKHLPTKLGQYPVPGDLKKCVLDGGDVVSLAPTLREKLEMKNYSAKFSALLHLEEIQQEIEMRDFDMERVCLRPFREFLALNVPGLAEGRPSLLIGDRVVLSTPTILEESLQYEGFIHEVMKDDILLKFHPDFHQTYAGEDYNVQFGFNRATLRRSHNAVNFVPNMGKQVLFPTSFIPKIPQTKLGKSASPRVQEAHVIKAQPIVGIRRCPLGVTTRERTKTHKFFNTILNPRQKAAVIRILNGQSRPTPYILFGPPGTGKTVTVVEAVLQVFTHIQSSRIIACTPSNSAADLLAERLHESGLVQQSDMVRLNAYWRQEGNILECLQPYCSDGDNLELVARYRIIVCTCSMAGMLYALGLKTGHFTHVFVDEAGQATEPECMVPIGLTSGADGQIVLAGDPLQLGPVLRSRLAKKYGLELSFLERLVNLPLYARDEQKFVDHGSYDPLLVTKLVENYRSHPILLHLPSEIFYHGELQVSGDRQMVECLCKWQMLPNKDNCPLIFHGVRGEDLREGDSPSWFNPVEAVQVMKYLQALVNNSVCPLTFDDIGIITPYRKQVEKIRLLIDRLDMDKVKVGSVEEFQGQERLVMIISTVRSNEELMGIDLRHNLGFLSNPKRFNVSITRAQALLIVVGNPHLLAHDMYWLALLRYAISNKAYTGCDLPEGVTPTPDPGSALTPEEADSGVFSPGVESEPAPILEPQEETLNKKDIGPPTESSKPVEETIEPETFALSKATAVEICGKENMATTDARLAEDAVHKTLTEDVTSEKCQNKESSSDAEEEKSISSTKQENKISSSVSGPEQKIVEASFASGDSDAEKSEQGTKGKLMDSKRLNTNEVESLPSELKSRALTETGNEEEEVKKKFPEVETLAAPEFSEMRSRKEGDDSHQGGFCESSEMQGAVSVDEMELEAETETEMPPLLLGLKHPAAETWKNVGDPETDSCELTESETQEQSGGNEVETETVEGIGVDDSKVDEAVVAFETLELGDAQEKQNEMGDVTETLELSGADEAIEVPVTEVTEVQERNVTETENVTETVCVTETFEPQGSDVGFQITKIQEQTEITSDETETVDGTGTSNVTETLEQCGKEETQIETEISVVQLDAEAEGEDDDDKSLKVVEEPMGQTESETVTETITGTVTEKLTEIVEEEELQQQPLQGDKTQEAVTEKLTESLYETFSAVEKEELLQPLQGGKAEAVTETMDSDTETESTDEVSDSSESDAVLEFWECSDSGASSDTDSEVAAEARSLSLEKASHERRRVEADLMSDDNTGIEATRSQLEEVEQDLESMPELVCIVPREELDSSRGARSKMESFPASESEEDSQGKMEENLHPISPNKEIATSSNATPTQAKESYFKLAKSPFCPMPILEFQAAALGQPVLGSPYPEMPILECITPGESTDTDVIVETNSESEDDEPTPTKGTAKQIFSITQRSQDRRVESTDIMTVRNNAISAALHSNERPKASPPSYSKRQANVPPKNVSPKSKKPCQDGDTGGDSPRVTSPLLYDTKSWPLPEIDEDSFGGTLNQGTRSPDPTRPQPSNLERKIIRQIEYYFGDFNLMKDKFLQEHIEKNEGGWVPLDLLVTFNRLQTLSVEFGVIVGALKKSSSGLVQVSKDELSVRTTRGKPWLTNKEQWKNRMKERAVAVEGVARHYALDDVQEFFQRFGDVEHTELGIPMLEVTHEKRCIVFTDLIIFFKQESVDVLRQRMKTRFYDGKPISYHFGYTIISESVNYFYCKRILGMKKFQLRPVGSRPPRQSNQNHHGNQFRNEGRPRSREDQGQGQHRQPADQQPPIHSPRESQRGSPAPRSSRSFEGQTGEWSEPRRRNQGSWQAEKRSSSSQDKETPIHENKFQTKGDTEPTEAIVTDLLDNFDLEDLHGIEPATVPKVVATRQSGVDCLAPSPTGPSPTSSPARLTSRGRGQIYTPQAAQQPLQGIGRGVPLLAKGRGAGAHLPSLNLPQKMFDVSIPPENVAESQDAASKRAADKEEEEGMSRSRQTPSPSVKSRPRCRTPLSSRMAANLGQKPISPSVSVSSGSAPTSPCDFASIKPAAQTPEKKSAENVELGRPSRGWFNDMFCMSDDKKGSNGAASLGQSTSDAGNYGHDIRDAVNNDYRTHDAANYRRSTGDAESYGHDTGDAANNDNETSDVANYRRSTSDAAIYGQSTSDAANYGQNTSDAVNYGHDTGDAANYDYGTPDAANYRRSTSDAANYGDIGHDTGDAANYGHSTSDAANYCSPVPANSASVWPAAPASASKQKTPSERAEVLLEQREQWKTDLVQWPPTQFGKPLYRKYPSGIGHYTSAPFAIPDDSELEEFRFPLEQRDDDVVLESGSDEDGEQEEQEEEEGGDRTEDAETENWT